MGQRITQVDAFTSERYRGNPAAICILESEGDAEWMQRVANEMNLSETAYLVPTSSDEFGLRWFTPAVEVDLCGHATVAAAHVLWEEGVVPGTKACRFRTRSGVLTARRAGDWIDVEFPLERVDAINPPADAANALGVKAQSAAECARLNYLLLELESEAAVRQASPDFTLASKVAHKGLIVTSVADARAHHDFVSRFFAPRMGVNEDPATGSAHCVLGPYWAAKLGRSELRAFQASPRGADLRVRVGGDRVTLGGQAVTVMRGELV
jgi:PhzF family phenazine biosynthesis protein